jgi:hypothetical protein
VRLCEQTDDSDSPSVSSLSLSPAEKGEMNESLSIDVGEVVIPLNFASLSKLGRFFSPSPGKIAGEQNFCYL